MLKKYKKTTIRQGFREIVEIRSSERVILYCEICQCEQVFKAIDENDINLGTEKKEEEKQNENYEQQTI